MTKKSAVKETNIEKIPIKGFKDGSSHWFVRYAHYFLNENNEVVWGAGETDKKELREALEQFIKRNKKQFKERESSIFENEPKEYKAVFTFGKHINKNVEEVKVIDKRWLTWCRDNFNFSSAQKELKEQIIEILKIK